MVKLGYALSSEEITPQGLIDNAKRAEEVGFTFALISDHFHPWIDQQGQSAFVWSVLGGISQVTKTLQIGTGVTCPILRIHPAIIAQAAATTASLFKGRFFLGIGTGENLNEHIIGGSWPPIKVRQAMITEAIEILKKLWEGKQTTFYGDFYTVEDARIYSLPEKAPHIYMAASGQRSATIAAEMTDGLISAAPDKQVADTFQKTGGKGKPRFGQITVCYAKNEKEAVQTALKWWPTSGLKGPETQEYRLPSYFQRSAKAVTEEVISKEIVCGPNPEKHIQEIQKYIDARYDHVYVHQVGLDQESFFQFYQKNILPKFQ